MDFNDIKDGNKVAVLLDHFTDPIAVVTLNDAVLAGDHEGNRCRARVASFDEARLGWIVLDLDLATFTPAPPVVRPPADPRDTLADRVLASIQSVLARGTQHVDDPRVHATEPVTGCPWCVDEARANALHARLGKRWPDEWPALDTFEARVLCARGDLARAER